MKVLIAEPLAAAGIELFQSQPGWEVIVSNPKEYAQHLFPDIQVDLFVLFVQVTKLGRSKGALHV